jgi:carbonic anhydrase
MSRLKEIIANNEVFVATDQHKSYKATKYPDKKMVVFSCMDTRLTHMLPAAMGLKNGDAKIIKNAGALIMHPFGSIMRSMVVAVHELGAEEIFVVGHYGCGMNNVDTDHIVKKMHDAGISISVIETLKHAGIDVHQWLHGFDCIEVSINETVQMIRNHPLIPDAIQVHGLVIDPETGKVDVLIDGEN